MHKRDKIKLMTFSTRWRRDLFCFVASVFICYVMSADDDPDIPESGAVFSFGKSNFADNIPSKFWIRNDPVSQIACGEEHTVAITETGRVFVFGNNDQGQLGQGFPNCAVKPTCIKGLKHERVVKIACGKRHTIAVTENGNFYGFGSNNEGQLGESHPNEVTEPVLITNSSFSIQQIDCGADDSAFLTNDGRLHLFGNHWNKNADTSPSELKLSCPVALMACGHRHLAFVTTNNKLYIIGPNERQNLDIRVDIEQQIEPIEGINEEMTKLSCGDKHTAILTANGKLYTLGDGMYGQLGLGTRNLDAVTPKLVSGLEHLTLKDVECGGNHVAVISENGSLFVFGDGSHGKLGLDNENFSNQFWPAKVLNFKMYSVEKVACGGYHTMVLARLRVPEEIESYGEEDVEPFRSASVESNDVVVSTARSRRHKRDMSSNTSLPPLKFPGKQFENEILSVKEAEEKKNVENLEENDKMENDKMESDKMESDAMNDDDDDDDDDVSEIVNFTDISDKRAKDVEKSPESIESDDETSENAKIPDEIVSFVNTQVKIVSGPSASPSSFDEPSVDVKGKRLSLTEKLPSRKSSLAFVDEESESEDDEESDQSEVEESHVTREIANAISEKDLQEASNSKGSEEPLDDKKRKKKRGKTVFNRMFRKTKSGDDKTENKKENRDENDENPNEEKTISSPNVSSPSKEPVPVISQSSLLCLPTKKIKLTQQENTENQSVTCTTM